MSSPGKRAWWVIAAALCAACGDDGSGSGAGGAGGASDGGEAAGGAGPVGGGGAAAGGAAPESCADGPAIGAEAACEACQRARCCTTLPGCADNPECVAIVACLDEGGSQTCLDDHPDGLWDYSGLATCRQNQCAAECGIEAATCGQIIPTPASCTEEVNAACCAETTTCGENDACVALIYQCLDENACADQACLDDCYAAFPDGVDDFEAMAGCWSDVACL